MVEYWLEFKKFLNSKGIKIIPIKTFLLPLYNDHIDCLVIGEKNYHKASQILAQAGFKKGRIFYNDRKKRFWRFPDNPQARGIHLHKICGWSGIGYLDPEKIWERKRIEKIGEHEVDFPSYEDEIIISALHSVFENKSIKEKEFFYLANIVDEEKLDWDYVNKTNKDIGCSTAFNVFWSFFLQAKEKGDIIFPIPIDYSEVLKAMLGRLRRDFKCLHFISLIKDIFSYALDIAIYVLRKKHL